MDAVLELYRDPMFWYYPVATTLIGLAAFLLFAAPWTLLAWIDPPSMRRYKIQDKPFEVGRWFVPVLGRMGLNYLLLIPVLILAWPLMRLAPIHMGELPAWWVIALQLLFFVLLDDFLYYWMHRLMHTRWLLKHVHSVHHRFRNPFALGGNYLHFIEFAMTIALMLIGPALLGVHIYVVWAWVVFRQFEAVDGHTGYDIPWSPSHWLPVYKGTPYHDFHHRVYQGNYAGFLPYLDRFWGTYARGYDDYLPAWKRPAAD